MLADDIGAELWFLRAQAESRMASRATVHRSGESSKDADGFEVDGWAPVLTDVAFRLAGADKGGSGTRTVTIGGVETQVAVRVGHFPSDTTGLSDGDLIEVTSGEHAGTFLQIVEATGADQQTALRLPVFEVPRPAGL